ncbi:uncharacterized protein BYT42DRAFT_41557 [Radiomyces spectabilis]|uniref:uncharacterized protein n=1 Tax=Radiomyces spectabilis TaxID=64574 RepID=UPI00221EC53E|nr:uncharacterized protein BYT42DRAFT_41557 [Radiomyces spectabilis]KAI8394348.1 hypothetical protein BYT42DRAFT_41557 [Radiomyces spectabilis]
MWPRSRHFGHLRAVWRKASKSEFSFFRAVGEKFLRGFAPSASSWVFSIFLVVLIAPIGSSRSADAVTVSGSVVRVRFCIGRREMRSGSRDERHRLLKEYCFSWRPDVGIAGQKFTISLGGSNGSCLAGAGQRVEGKFGEGCVAESFSLVVKVITKSG